MSEHLMETRRRSRSKTPFLRSSCDHENCEHAGEEGHHHHHHKKKTAAVAPTVQTIAEEDFEPKSKIAKLSNQQVTSDYSSEDLSPETKTKKGTKEMKSNENAAKAAVTSKTVKSTTAAATSNSMPKITTTSSSSSSTVIIEKTQRIVNPLGNVDAISGATTSTPKSKTLRERFTEQFYSPLSLVTDGSRIKETTQNAINTEVERNQMETALNESYNKSKESNFSRFFLSPFGSTKSNVGSANAEANNHIAYMEYKRAGEYWKTTPKTDYTYSELSPHRRELAPGVVAMPNMSRRSLENHYDRINYMIQREPAQEEYIRRRYETSRFAQNREAQANLAYDSGDELDYRRNTAWENLKNESWYMRIITTVVSTITNVWSTVTGNGGDALISDRYSSALYRTQLVDEERGFFGKIGHGITTAFMSVMRAIYISISSILCLDAWLLQSSNVENKNRKRFLLFLLLLLPLLLLAAWQLLEERERFAYIQSAQSLIPFSLLAGLKTSLYSTGSTFQNYIQDVPLIVKDKFNSLHFNWVGETSQQMKIDNLQRNLQKTLSPEEYENILNHVNSYVQTLVNIKLQEQQEKEAQEKKTITPEQTKIIVDIMRTNLERVIREKRELGEVNFATLSAKEVEKLAHLVQIQLVASGWSERPVRLSAENIAEIKKLITEQIQIDNHLHYNLIVEKIDLDALLSRILSAPELAVYVDARINAAIERKLQMKESDHETLTTEQHKLTFENLNKEIEFIKLALADKGSANQNLNIAINKLELNQADLLKRLQENELSTDNRFSAVLADIEEKFKLLKAEQFTLLNQQIKLSLVEILGFKDQAPAGVKLEEIDLQNWVRNVFVAKDYLEERLMALNEGTNNKIRDEIDRTGVLLMRDISERLKKEVLTEVTAKHIENNKALHGELRAAVSEDEVRKIVKSVLAVYDADKTGLVDYALESAGGQILSTRCTENYQTKTALISVFGIPIWYPSNTPRVAISPNVRPGECWAFQGFPGYLVLKLNSLVYVTGFTLEHIPKSLSPNGRIESAPRNFTVWGLEHEKDFEPVLFGEYEYEDNDASLQYFPVKNETINRPYQFVELRIESNHGLQTYTCLYRFRVHGKPQLT